MAKVDVFRSAAATFIFYNLDDAVGKGCANRRDDVLLVQYLLKTSAHIKGQSHVRVGGYDQAGPGVWSDFDDALLKGVQSEWSERGLTVWQDRRVDPLPQHNMRTQIHQAQYTILTLNVLYQRERPADYPRMALAADCPPELRPLIPAPSWLGSTAGQIIGPRKSAS